MLRKVQTNNYQEIFHSLNKEVSSFPQNVSILAVSKYVDSTEIKKAYQSGFRDFGENRVPDLIQKAEELKDDCPEIRWHFIGNIQSNKIKELMSLKSLHAIHSLDSYKHLKMIGERAISPLKIFVQVNTSDESQKGGVESIEQILKLTGEIEHYPYLFFSGLMCMAPIGGDLDSARESFERLKKLSNQFTNCELSMGMSGDYQIALELGANYIRVGSKIFK